MTVAARRDNLGAWNASPKLQRAARAFLLRLVAENGIEETARAPRELAKEIEGLPDFYDEGGRPARPGGAVGRARRQTPSGWAHRRPHDRACGSIHPPGPRTGAGRCTCSRPNSPQSRHLTRSGYGARRCRRRP